MKQNDDNEGILLRDLADYLPGVVFRVTVNLDGRFHIAFVCKAAEQVLGFDPHEIERDPSRLFELVPAEQRKEIDELLSKFRKADQKIKQEICIRRRNGDEGWLRIEARPRPRPDAGGDEWFGVAMDMTESRKRDRELSENQALIESIVASVEDAIFVIGPPHRQVIQSANPAVEKIFGYLPGELEGQTTEILHENRASFELFGRSTEKVLETHQSFRGEYRMRRRNGEVFPTEHVITIMHPEAGWQGGVVSVVRDLTHRKLTEKTLYERENRYRSVLETAMDGFWMMDPNGRLIEVNDTYCRMSGYSERELVDLYVYDLDAGEDAEAVKAHLEKVKRRREDRFESRHRRKDGTFFEVEASVQYHSAEGGQFACFFRDITERKRMEFSLREREHLFREVFDHMSSCASIYESPDNGQNFIFKDLNRAGLACGRKTKAEVVGRDVREVFPGVEAMGLLDVFRHVWRTGIPEEHPSSVYKDEQVELWVENYVCRLPSGQLLAIYEDTTARKRAEEEKENWARQIQRAQKMEAIGNLAGGIAHDFNNLLSPIIGFSEMLLDDLPAGGSEREKVEDILKAAKRSSDLVRQILAFSRQAEVKPMPVRIQTILKEAISLSRSTIPSYIEIVKDLQENCGKVTADPSQIHQVVMNLITNAFHAVEPENGRIVIELKETYVEEKASSRLALPPGRYARLTVSDTGVGIDPFILDKLFEPYFTTKEKGKGTGLGLAVVYGIVKDHGGDIKVSSEFGKGSSFQVYLPVAVVSETTTFNEPAHLDYVGDERILLVDDEEMVMRMVKQMLVRLGYEVRGYTRSLDALEAFAVDPDGFDLVVTDMAMPTLSGDRLARSILDIRGDIPVILFTGFNERIDRAKAADMGISDVLMKPILKDSMARAVRKALDKQAPSE